MVLPNVRFQMPAEVFLTCRHGACVRRSRPHVMPGMADAHNYLHRIRHPSCPHAAGKYLIVCLVHKKKNV